MKKNISTEFRPSKPEDYGPLLKLGFQAIKYFFLFIAGFSIACVISACLDATQVLNVLQVLASKAFGPLSALTFCIVAIVVLLESFQ